MVSHFKCRTISLPLVKEKVMWVFDRERAHQARLLCSATGGLADPAKSRLGRAAAPVESAARLESVNASSRP